ncbi:MAG: amidohydrolase family protein [Candidatus Hydrogenedentes bacterium]|nr:amidohydrolase family protein [Candidatus Hydrogenedentota bacterium]
MIQEIAELIRATAWVDTHEHLWDESTRLRLSAEGKFPSDFSAFFFGYPTSDLLSAGLPAECHQRLFSPVVDVATKWRDIEPYYKPTWHTGYMRNVRASIHALTGEDEIDGSNCGRISEALAKLLQPGHYRQVLRTISNIEYCQVASLEAHVFHETESPDLLCQDFHFDPLCLEKSFVPGDVMMDLAQAASREPSDLSAWYEIIEWHFARFAPRAIALKHASAYQRRLDYEPVSSEAAAPLFDRYRRDPSALSDEERKALHDHLFHFCVRQAVDYNLPIKMHTGYHAGVFGMPLRRVQHNLSDLCPVFQLHPDARFVLFHMGFPYQHEAMALAKHYPNVFIDLSWAWIISPSATGRFVKEFLVSAPATKLLCFGGDYWNLEGVPGHAVIARQGLARSLSELVQEAWIDNSEVSGMIRQLMRDNPYALFDYQGRSRNWSLATAIPQVS